MIQRYLAFTFIASIALGSPAIANDDRTLASVASADGYTYAWLPTEAGVVLSRPGVRVVLRPGRIAYEVNNATPIADRAPIFNGEDLLISPALAARLGEIAAHATPSVTSVTPARTQGANDRSAAAVRPVTIETQIVPGRLALAINGTGTPNTSITITLTGEISRELPVVLIRRAIVPIDADGTYAIEMSYGPDAHEKSIITATALAATGNSRAIAHITVSGEPTGVSSTGLDVWNTK